MDLSTSTGLLAFVQNHGYFIVFLLVIVEGPLTNYVAAFASSLGFFNVYIILILSILANYMADLIYFFIGRLGKKALVERRINNLLDSERIKKIKEYLGKNPGKILTIIKIAPPLPMPGLILAGTTNMKTSKFIFYSFIITVVLSSFFTVLGYFSGMAFNIIPKYFKYGELIITAALIVILAIWIWLRFNSEKISKRIKYI